MNKAKLYAESGITSEDVRNYLMLGYVQMIDATQIGKPHKGAFQVADEFAERNSAIWQLIADGACAAISGIKSIETKNGIIVAIN